MCASGHNKRIPENSTVDNDTLNIETATIAKTTRLRQMPNVLVEKVTIEFTPFA